MNNTRRKKLQKQIEILNEVADCLDNLRDEEDEYRDNMPENLEGSQRYEESEECSDAIDAAASCTREAIENIQDAI